MKPKKLSVEKENLIIKWNDDKISSIQLSYLRKECPCAGCKGETILLRTYRPAQLPIYHPEMFKIKKIETVGDYAIKIIWKDGHDTGIYSWEYLLQLANDQHNEKEQKYESLL